MKNMVNLTHLLPNLLNLVDDVSSLILPIYDSQDILKITTKQDGSPVTEADHRAHERIAERLAQLTPDIPLLSEEASNILAEVRLSWKTYWLVDPIDGTKEFIAKNGEFTVNIALIHEGQPIIGVVAVPVKNEIYYAMKTHGAWKKDAHGLTPLRARAYDAARILEVLSSRRHDPNTIKALAKFHERVEYLRCGSSLKFCLLAEGKADLYPRLAPTSEWDTAAAQCVLEEAGGAVINLQGQPLRYNQKGSLENPHFLAVADPSVSWAKWFNL